MFFGPIGKTILPPWPLNSWEIFDFSSETADWNWKKLDRKQDLNVLYQVCVFRADQKTKMAALADSSKRWHIVLRCTICGPLGILFFCGYRGFCYRSESDFFFFAQVNRKIKRMATLAYDCLTAKWNSIKYLAESTISASSTKYYFGGNRKTKIAALASDWLRHFQLLLWNHWMEFNQNW